MKNGRSLAHLSILSPSLPLGDGSLLKYGIFKRESIKSTQISCAFSLCSDTFIYSNLNIRGLWRISWIYGNRSSVLWRLCDSFWKCRSSWRRISCWRCRHRLCADPTCNDRMENQRAAKISSRSIPSGRILNGRSSRVSGPRPRGWTIGLV